MRRKMNMLQQVKSAQESWEERGVVTLAPSLFPADAVAIIYKPGRSATTSGNARTREWKLRFEPRMPRYIEPLMGWTGHDDPLAQIELNFRSMEAAVGYARSKGLHYVVQGHARDEANVHQVKEVESTAPDSAQSGARPSRRQRGDRSRSAETIPDDVQSGNIPSLRYGAPQDVLSDPVLTKSEKRDVLRRWALDAYAYEASPSNRNAKPHASSVDEIIDALIALDESELRRFIERASKSTARARPLAA